MLEKLRDRFVEEAKHWYRHFSMQLAALVSFVVVPVLLNAPEILMTIFKEMPPEMRAWAPAWLGPVLFGVLFVARYWRQRKPADGE